MKKCTKCGVEKPVTSEHFCRHRSNKSGFRGNCKACEFAYRELNKERINAKIGEWRLNNKDKINEYAKSYALANKEQERERTRVWHKENPNGYSDWCSKNAEGIKIRNHARRSKMRSLPSTLTLKQWDDVKKHFDFSCAYCGDKKPLEQDHFVPLSKDGEYTRDNIIPACKSCNSSKSNKEFFEWYSESENYSIVREKRILKYLRYESKNQQLSIL